MRLWNTVVLYSARRLFLSLPSATLRLVFMGLAMGATAIAIILSPMGRRSGAHFNPIVSFTFFCLGRMHRLDAMFYVVAQFVGGALGVFLARILLGADLASPSVRYVVTVPGRYGVGAAFLAECFMGLLTDDRSVAERQQCAPCSRFTLVAGWLARRRCT